MSNFEIILWDVDGTLLDFKAAEKAAIKTLFREFDLGECSDEMIQRYSEINKKYWSLLERGELTKPVILTRRFEEFFSEEGLDPSLAPQFNSAYQIKLGDTVVFRDNSKDIVSSLIGHVGQYVVSNGTVTAQTKKLCVSGFDKLMDGIFLSEQLGYEKPAVEFFDTVLEHIPYTDKSKVLIVGDSLTSDILGGNNAGIKSCWYNPEHLQNTTAAKPDFEIHNLSEVFTLLNDSQNCFTT